MILVLELSRRGIHIGDRKSISASVGLGSGVGNGYLLANVTGFDLEFSYVTEGGLESLILT